MIHANSPFSPEHVDLDLTVRCGLEFIYETPVVTPIFLLIKPRLDARQHIEKEQLVFEPRRTRVWFACGEAVLWTVRGRRNN